LIRNISLLGKRTRFLRIIGILWPVIIGVVMGPVMGNCLKPIMIKILFESLRVRVAYVPKFL